MNDPYKPKSPEIIASSTLSVPTTTVDSQPIPHSGTIPFNSDPHAFLAQKRAERSLEIAKLEASQAIGETSQK